MEKTSVIVRVPATTANLGPGFDVLGLALDLWNEAEFVLDDGRSAASEPASVFITGEGAAFLPVDGSNLVVRSALRLFSEAGRPVPARLRIRCANCIPNGSGLGSSAAACVAGLMGANSLLGEPFGSLDILRIASEIEHHPDNAAAAVLGGLTVVVAQGGHFIARKIEIPPLAVAVAVPEFNLPTRAARAALPRMLDLPDAIFNLGHMALVIEALRSGDLELLGQAMHDRLHQPYRLKLVPGCQDALAAARQAGASAAALSGAGPGVIAFGRGDMAPAGQAMQSAFQSAGLPARFWTMTTSTQGAYII
jgi:homoserine kinase